MCLLKKENRGRIYLRFKNKISSYYLRLIRQWKRTLASLFVLIVAPIVVLFVYDYWQLWRSQRGVELGTALYVYERNFEIKNQNKICFWEMRNLFSNCRLYEVHINVSPNRSICQDPVQLLLMKVRIQNKSSISISKLKIGISGMGINFERIFSTPNAVASLSVSSGMNEAISAHVINISQIAPKDTVIVTLEKNIDKKEYIELVERGKITISIPFIASNEFKNKINQKFIEFDANEMMKQEAALFTGERTFPNEKINWRNLSPNEANTNQLMLEKLPQPKDCRKADNK